MTAPPDAQQSWWEDEGRRVAAQLHDVFAALVVGTSAEHASQVALGIARAESDRRHVALGDLTGDAAPLYAVAGGEDAFGLTDCLRQGLPLNDIARPAPGRESLFILPAGSPPVACPEILAHERWPRLVNGFAKVGALLLLVAPHGAPGLEALAAATGGAVLVEVDGPAPGRVRVLANIVAPVTTPAPARRAGRRAGRRVALVAFVAVVALAVAGWFARRRLVETWRGRAAARAAAQPKAGIPAAPATAAQTPPPVDTVRLTDPVNPADTAATAAFAVEVMAANTLAGANSFLSENVKSAALSGATLSPVAVGGSGSVWYKVVVGASHMRAGADSLLAALRQEGLVRSGQGRVVKVPYALVLADNIDRAKALGLDDAWRQRGFRPYVLMQQDGSARVLVGAFETTAQAAPLASALRAAGAVPVLAFRTGRTY